MQKSKEFGRKAEEAVSRFFNKAARKDRLEVHTVFRAGDTACGNDIDISIYRNLAGQIFRDQIHIHAGINIRRIFRWILQFLSYHKKFNRRREKK